MMRRALSRSRRSFVLIAVMVIVSIALLVATGVIFLTQAEITGARNETRFVQTRALAWSGVQIVTAQLNRQRDRILESRLPEIGGQFVVYESNGRAGIVRLLPVNERGDLLAPEASKLDLNAADAPRLASLGFVDEPTANAIVAYRENTLKRPFQSVAEIMQVEGVTPEVLYGPLEEVTPMDDARNEPEGMGERLLALHRETSPRGLADIVTVFGFEPAVQKNGRLRINLNVPWSEELGRRVDERFGEGSGEFVRQIMEGGTTFESEKKIVQVLRSFNSPVEDWPDILDALTAEAGDYHFGRLDINTAPYEALLSLPGVTAEQAAQIVRRRESLSDDLRQTIVWPAIEKILEPAAYEELAALLTTRSWTFRVRFAAGETDAEETEGPLDQPILYEAVIDLCAPTARIAYLREITHLQTAAMIAKAASAATEIERSDSPSDPGHSAEDPPPSGVPEADANGTSAEGPADAEDALETEESKTASPADDSTVPPSDADRPGTRRRIGRWLGGA